VSGRQPTLSMQIRKLEEDLGAPLIERTPRSVMLTPFGEDTVERARRIMAEIDEIKVVGPAQPEPRGRHLAPRHLPDARAVFPAACGAAHPRAVSAAGNIADRGKSDALLARLRSGNLDAAILPCQSTMIT
jgi:LysR family hydrogen peroxide-inducible transcriptional activator